MAERYHSIGNGIWQGCESCHDGNSFFDEKDVVDVFTDRQIYTLYNVAVRLKDGRVICPDYTASPTKADIDQETEWWKSLLMSEGNKQDNIIKEDYSNERTQNL